MNKQPFYHCGRVLKGSKKTVIQTISGIKGVIQDSIDYYDKELLFTATLDVSGTANKLLNRNSVILECDIDAETGDPSDLM